MRKYFIACFLCILLVLGCTRGKRDINLFNEAKYTIHDDEKVVELNKGLLTEYASFIVDSTMQIPLYRCVVSPNYKTFIGLALHTPIDKLSKSHIISPDSCEYYFDSDDKNLLYRTYKNSDTYIAECFMSIGANQIYLVTVSLPTFDLGQNFSREAIIKRIVKTK